MNGRSTLRKAIAGLLKKTSSKVTTETPNPDSNTNDSLVERTRSIRVK